MNPVINRAILCILPILAGLILVGFVIWLSGTISQQEN